MNNQKQLHLMITYYAADYDDHLPLNYWAPITTMDEIFWNWYALLWQYYKVEDEPVKIFNSSVVDRVRYGNLMYKHWTCPSSTDSVKEEWYWWNTEYGVNSSKGAFVALFSEDKLKNNIRSNTFTRVVTAHDPSRLMLVMDSSAGCRAFLPYNANPAYDYPTYHVGDWHNDGPNIMYFDGHGGRMDKDEIPTDEADPFWGDE